MNGARGERNRPARWSLRRQLVVGITVVVAIALGLAGLVTVITVDASVTRVVTGQLESSLSAFHYSVAKYRDNARPLSVPADTAALGPKGFSKPLTDFVGHGYGSLIALAAGGEVLDSAIFTEEDPQQLSAEVGAELLAAVETSHGEPTTVQLSGLGDYRVRAVQGADQLLVAGVSLDVAHDAVRTETTVVALIGLVTLAAVIAGTIVIVRLALRPLGRLTQVARSVARLRLDSGEERIGVRVDPRDTDDRTEVGQVGDALNRMLEHVDDAFSVRSASDRRMRAFVTDASHELRTPLAAIQGYAQLTRHEADTLPDMTEHALNRIESEAQRMGALVADLLLLARLDEGQDLQFEPVDLSELAVTALEDATAAAPDHEWFSAVPAESVVVNGDRERLQQLCANLLSNAAVHTPPGTSVTVHVARVASSTGGCAELVVTDDGPGVDPELVPRLFDRFVRGDRSRARGSGSTGLGLAICASIAEAHRGSITVVSSTSNGVGTETAGSSQEHGTDMPAGTAFTVRLPLYESAFQGSSTLTGDGLGSSSVAAGVVPFAP